MLLVALVIVGYLVSWAAFGLLVCLGALFLQRLASSSSWVQPYLWLGPSLLLALEGLFQLSSLEYRCLDKCRSPMSFVLSHWQGRQHRWQALRLGASHGLFCVGCCRALMLLMFAASTAHLLWMLTLGLLMAVEKNVTWGRRIGRPLGVALLAGAVVLLVI